MRATKSNICCEALFPRYRRRKRVLSRRQFRMRSLAGRRSKDKAAPSIARSGPADVLAPPCRPDRPAPGRSRAANRRSFRPAGRLSSTTRIFSPCRIRWSRRHGVPQDAAVAFDLMPSVSCTMWSARDAPFTWFHEERCKRQRRCSTTAFSKSAAFSRQGVPPRPSRRLSQPARVR